MNTTLSYPEPQNVFRYFYEMSQIPRPSGREEAISEYLVSFAKEHGLEWYRDAANNVIMIKEASAGREAEEPVILQGHMDMVCEKETGCTKDMDTEGLDLVLEGDWLSAEGTTLGGDDGIAPAIVLALLEDDTLSHPRLEFVCTTEEETGMGGATALDPAPLKGHLLLNIDSEEEGVMTAGCAGGVTLTARIPLTRETCAAEEAVPVRIRIRDLTGGHSGSYIQFGRANADVEMTRILRVLSEKIPVRLCSFTGGTKHNAIPREAEAVFMTGSGMLDKALEMINDLGKTLQAEYAVTDPAMKVCAEPCAPGSVPAPCTQDCTAAVLALLSSVPDGVQRMDPHLEGQVETSLNLGVLYMTDGELYAEYLLRSSSESRLTELEGRISCIAAQAGVPLEHANRYPAWQFVPDSAFREKVIRIFREQYGKDPVVETTHGGLECGLLSDKIPGLDAVSLGPTIVDIHTPQERMSVSSVQRTYDYIRRILEQP